MPLELSGIQNVKFAIDIGVEQPSQFLAVHTINLFLWPTTDNDTSIHTSTIRGYNLVNWTQSRMSYWAISDLNRDELTQFARYLHSP